MRVPTAFSRLFRRPYRTIDVAEAVELLDGGAILLDVREPTEWRAGHAPKARHIPLDRLPGRLRELPGNRPVVTVCRSGARSARAAALLAAEGHTVANLRGGMRAWSRAGHPIVAAGGRRGVIH